METALKAGNPVAAELVACECVVLAETKDHANWELITKVAEKSTGEQKKVLQAAVKSRIRRTSTSTIPRDGAGSFGWNRSE
jgi:hypothetical protein